MPHKRKRRTGPRADESESEKASGGHAQTRRKTDSDKKPSRRREEGVSRSFARMLAQAKGIRPPSGLDEGDDRGKPRAKAEHAQPSQQGEQKKPQAQSPNVPAIMPGERLADYSARVDAALPLQGKMKRGKGPAIPGLRQPQTRTERKMQRMQDEWRREDGKIKAREQEATADLEDEMDEQLPGVAARQFALGKKDAFDDPWAAVAKSRAAKEKQNGLIGLHDVVQAPPRLKPQRAIVREGRSA